MDNISDKRKYAAYLARQFYAGKKSIKLIEDEFPHCDTDVEIHTLLKMIKNTPKRKGLFKVSFDKYESYVTKVYELIEKFEK